MCVEPFCEEEGGGGEEAVEGSGRGWAEEVCFVWVGGISIGIGGGTSIVVGGFSTVIGVSSKDLRNIRIGPRRDARYAPDVGRISFSTRGCCRSTWLC